MLPSILFDQVELRSVSSGSGNCTVVERVRASRSMGSWVQILRGARLYLNLSFPIFPSKVEYS